VYPKGTLAMAPKEEVAEFLREFKKLISINHDVDFYERPERNSTLLHLGWTKAVFIQELQGLSVEDYCSGPDKDRNRPGVIWVFGKEINGHEYYIKLKIVDMKPLRFARCFSFHEAEFPIRYLYK
jgi:hypothetical protein